MVQGTPYVHWKIKQRENLSEIDPTYLWGTVIETNKGPIDEPVFIRNPEESKKIFNYNLDPFFANGGRYVAVVRAYAGEPKAAVFDITLDEDFSYVYVDNDYYEKGDKGIKATVRVDDITAKKPKAVTKGKIPYAFTSFGAATNGTQYGTGVAQATGVVSGKYTEIIVKSNDADTPEQTFTGQKFYVLTELPEGQTRRQLFKKAAGQDPIDVWVEITEIVEEVNVAFKEGRWRICDEDGVISYFYDDNGVSKQAVQLPNDENYYIEGTTQDNKTQDGKKLDASVLYTKSFNESDVKRIVISKVKVIPADEPIAKVEALYKGDFLVPISIAKDLRTGYRISVTDSENYTILISSATTLKYIVQRINERAQNVKAYLTASGEDVQKVFSSTLVPAVDGEDVNGNPIILPTIENEVDVNLEKYNDAIVNNKIPVGSIFTKTKATEEVDIDNNIVYALDDYEIKLTEIVSYLGDGSNGSWDSDEKRIREEDRIAAHKEALDHLATVKLAGIFCNYGEDDLQRVYYEHVSVSEPEGMNSAEVCKWRSLIVGANANDRINDLGQEPGFKLIDKATSIDNENILFLGQGLIDDGFIPNDIERAKDTDSSADEFQLLPYQTTQYIAGLRSKLFYGDAIFGGEAKKEIKGVGNIRIAPLFAGENKLLWQPDNYIALNEKGVLTFTQEYDQLSLTDGVTTRQTPLEEDEESIQSIIKYAKQNVHAALQEYIGMNVLGGLQSAMDGSVRNVLLAMQEQDQTLIAIPSEGLDAFDSEIVLIPKSNAQQTLARAYVYLKLTPVHALRQIEVELTVQ